MDINDEDYFSWLISSNAEMYIQKTPIQIPNPTTSIPTMSPTITDITIPIFVQFIDPTFYREFIKFNEGISGQICYSDNQHLFFCGGYNNEYIAINTHIDTNINTIANKCFVYNDEKALLSLTIYINNKQISNLYCKNQCYTMFQNKIFLVNPIINSQQHKHSLYKCITNINNNNNNMNCIDLCDNNLEYCHELKPVDSCITSNKQYLYICGGYDIYDNILLDKL